VITAGWFLPILLLGDLVFMGSDLKAADEPLMDVKAIYELAARVEKGEISDIQVVKNYINATVAYYNSVKPLPMIKIDPEIWRKAKITEILYRTSQCFSDLEVSPYCLQKICELYSGDADLRRKNFKLAESLLVSQCEEYNFGESPPAERFICKLLPKADNVLVGTAINKLRTATNGDIDNSQKLLNLLHNIAEFKRFIPLSKSK
jgi:hypothetical protein